MDITLEKIKKWQAESEEFHKPTQNQWAENIKALRGIPIGTNSIFSSINPKRGNVMIRKMWAMKERIKAGFVASFLRAKRNFLIEGRDKDYDSPLAHIMQKLMEFRVDEMRNLDKFYIKHIWAFEDMWTCGVSVGKLIWKYIKDKDGKVIIDRPRYSVYPPEQVYFDTIPTLDEDESRYIILESFMTESNLKRLNFDKAPKLVPYKTNPANNPVRQARYYQLRDPVHYSYHEKQYLRQYFHYLFQKNTGDLYRIWEVFYRDDEGIKYCVTNEGESFLLKPKLLPGHRTFPVIIGSCFTEAHQVIPESISNVVKPLQENYNYWVNKRREAVDLLIRRRWMTLKDSGIDMEQFRNAIMGGIVEVDDMNAIAPIQEPDIPQSTYNEAQIDESSMNEIAGITDLVMGRGSQYMKSTTAQINQTNAMQVFEAQNFTIGESYFRPFYLKLAELISEFETNDNMLRIANESIHTNYTFNALEDFNFSLKLEVSPSPVTKQILLNNISEIIGLCLQSNQAMMQFVNSGLANVNMIKLFDISKFVSLYMENIGGELKNADEFLVEMAVNQPQPGQQQMSGMGTPNLRSQQQNPNQQITM